jgi:glycosyltransferase involved in cell wall biosynthesis
LMVRALDLGGSERQLAVVARTLDPAEFHVHVGCFRSDGVRAEELRAAGVRLVEFPVSSFVKPSAVIGAYRMARYLVEHQIKLVHTFDWPMNVFAVPVARAVGGITVLSSQRAHRELSPGLPRHLLRVTDQLADAIVVNSKFVKRHLVEDEKVAPGRIHLCYNGVDLEAFSPACRRKPPEFEDASLVLGVVCAVRPEKGLGTLVDAFARISHHRGGLKLAVVGGGPSLPELQARSRELGIADRCIFIPPRNDVTALLQGMDIFVLPSLSEAFSNALMEAMACGCTAVASEVGGNLELVVNGKTGLLFTARDVAGLSEALELLIENPELRQRLAAAGARFIHGNFSREAAAQRMAKIYKSVLSGR